MRRLAALAAVMLAGCSGAAAPPPSPSDPPAASASPSASIDPDGVHEFLGAAPLEPGVTSFARFEPPFTFVVPQGWEGGHAHADYFDVWNGADFVVGFGRPIAIPGPDGRIDIETLSPRGALRAMAELVDEPTAISQTKIDGRPAFEMSFSVDRRAGVLRFDAGVLHIEPPWHQRAIAFDMEGALLIFLLQSRQPDGALDSPVLSSVEFED